MFADATRALGELLLGEELSDPVQLRLGAEAADDSALLVEWLSELIYLADAAGFAAEQADDVELADGRVTATVSGRYGLTSHLVKAVTYHALELEQGEEGWRAHVVFDV